MELPGQVSEVKSGRGLLKRSGPSGATLANAPSFISQTSRVSSMSEVSQRIVAEKIKETPSGKLAKIIATARLRVNRGNYFVDENRFHCAIALVIVVNAITIGLETDFGCRGSCSVSQRGTWYILDVVFTCIFLIEMSLKFRAYSVIGYFLSPWNQFDFVLVVFAILDTGILSHMPNNEVDLKLFSVLRIVRILKLVRLVRLVRAFHELYLIVSGMVEAFKTVCWVFIVLGLILWCLAIFITIVVGQDENPEQYDFSQVYWTRDDYWGTSARSMFSLYQLMTSDGWVSSLARPVLAKYPLMIVYFLICLCVTTFGLLNIIVGVIVENTLAAAGRNEAKISRMLEKAHKRALTALRTIFETADKEGNGNMTREEFNKTIKKKYVKERLGLIDIPAGEMHELFSLLDADDSGTITIDEFQKGCMRMKGAAKSKDMIQLSMHIKAYNFHLDELNDDVNEQNEVLDTVLKRLQRTEKEFRNAQQPKDWRIKKQVVVMEKPLAFRTNTADMSDEDDDDGGEPEEEPLFGGRIPEPPPLPPGVAVPGRDGHDTTHEPSERSSSL